MNVAQFDFRDGLYGWSESYYDNNDLAGQSVTKANATTLGKYRKAMLAGPGGGELPTQPVITEVSISTIGDPRATLSIDSLENAKNQVAPSQFSPDNPYSAYYVTLTALNGHKSNRFFSGIPDEAIADQRGVFNTTGFFGALSRMMNYLTAANSPWGVLTHAPSPTPVNLITNVTIGPDGYALLTLENALVGLGDSCSEKVVIGGWKGAPGTPNINGVHSVMFQDAGLVIKLSKKYPPLSPICMGYAWMYTPAFSKFNSWKAGGPAKKSRGRPRKLPRGRARPRC